ncbi:MAG: AAA family ATPase [bacterium]|nr:AAA family ATPase [bacterium]
MPSIRGSPSARSRARLKCPSPSRKLKSLYLLLLKKNAHCLIIKGGGTMNPQPLKKIPYGISDYTKLVRENFYYVDKTAYLPVIENAGDYLFFIRPRRFGKSLFLSMMKSYYDVYYKEQFETLFKDTWILDNPTEKRGAYLVLFLNFSEVSAFVDKMEESFLSLIKRSALAFSERYYSRLSVSKNLEEYLGSIKESELASDIVGYLSSLVKAAGHKMYIIIDEYDNFANTLLTTSGDAAYHGLTHGDGFLRTFFNVLKAGTGDTDSPIARLFIAGVSPVTMDDVTSGFNIGENVSLDLALNRMLGFTENDVTDMIEYYRGAGKITHAVDQLKPLMAQWYGNYIFSGDDDVSLFNSDMILYFLKNYMKRQKLPENLIDRNVRIDYGKLRHLIIIDRDKTKPPITNGNFSKLKQIIAEGDIVSNIVNGFPLAEMTETNNFNSLLFYFGLLTIAGREKGRYRLTIPNETVKRLYYDYMERAYKETGMFSLDMSKYVTLISDMAFDGAWFPLLDFISRRMKESLALRDLITGEKAVQTFLNVYLGLSDLFIVHTEKEMNNGYADILMEAHTAKYPELNVSFLLELKYEKTGMNPEDPKLPQIVAGAEEQVKKYALDEKFNKTVGAGKLIKLVLIFSGHEAVYIGEAK